MAGMKEKAAAGSKFGAVEGARLDRLNLLSPAERRARGLMRAIADAKTAAARALEASEAQAKRAAEHYAQAKQLEAELAALEKAEESEEPEAPDA